MITGLNKKIKLLDIRVSKLMNNTFFGNYKSAFKGKGIEFGDLREYDYSDDAKDIDWKVSARSGKVYIKKYVESRELKIYFAIDVSESMNFGTVSQTKSDIALDILYTLGLSAIKNNDRIGALFFDDQVRKIIPLNKGKSTLINIVNTFSDFTNNKNNSLSNLQVIVNTFKKLKIGNSLIFILTDKFEIDNYLMFKSISKNNQILYINILDNMEAGKLDLSTNLFVGSSFNRLNTYNHELQSYKKIVDQKLEFHESNLLKQGIDHLLVSSSDEIYSNLLKYFKYKTLKN